MSYIMIIEDDIDNRAIVTLALQERGFRCVSAANGLEALRHIAEPHQPTRPYLILLDLNMPVLDGYGFLNIVNLCSNLSKIPLIIMTGENNPPTGYKVLPKPVNLIELYDLAAEAYLKVSS